VEKKNKSGIAPNECVSLVEDIIKNCKNLSFNGLMTIGAYDNVPSDDQPDFKKLIECKKEVCEKLGLNPNNFQVSMGMSSDYEKAIEMGSTNVRVGSLIFGAREYHNK